MKFNDPKSCYHCPRVSIGVVYFHHGSDNCYPVCGDCYEIYHRDDVEIVWVLRSDVIGEMSPVFDIIDPSSEEVG